MTWPARFRSLRFRSTQITLALPPPCLVRGRKIRFKARLWTLELKESVNHLDRIINMTGKSRISICMK